MGAALSFNLTGGVAYPLGAHCSAAGVNFALVAPAASKVELCLFDAAGQVEMARLPLALRSGDVWHGQLEGAGAGLVYGYRVHGPSDPAHGARFDPELVLLDPYARDVVGSYHGQHGALRARVTDDSFDWGRDVAPRTALADTVIYELHVKGFTRLMTAVPEPLRGTYAGLAHAAALDHLQALGVTAVSLLPLHLRADESRLAALGLSNYWGYSSIGFFAPEPRYWSGRAGSTPASELRTMVAALHERGIEVILDVVYNHTGELDEAGPTLSLRGIDNALYYHLDPADPSQYRNWTGCGNTLNLSEPRVLQLVMDSLRYWVTHFHVDGFRFDLAPALARNAAGFDPHAAFFAALLQDPVLAGVKLIAEPWDVGPDGYQLGHFPEGWLEWNDQYRDTMRRFWLSGDVTLGQFALRFAGSSDLFQPSGRQISASVNYIAAHDGFTLRDLVSYNQRHNHANGEDNRDGHGHNLSWNCGVEGASADPKVQQLRLRLQRAMLATLFLSHGTPMLLAGSELGHTQGGNNNAYCQDNAISWLNWEEADHALIDFVARLTRLRRAYPALRRCQWDTPVEWRSAEGAALDHDDWNRSGDTLAIRLGEPDAQCLLLINAGIDASVFSLPAGAWDVLLDSSDPAAPARQLESRATVPARAVLLTVDRSIHHSRSPA
ncbi:MAG: glycogen debranching protein GlgX [Pseudomonadota bacterium]